MRSKTPPCPGSRPLLSFTPAWRFSRLSNRSPTIDSATRTSMRQHHGDEPQPCADDACEKIGCCGTASQDGRSRAPMTAAMRAADALPGLARADARGELALAERAAGEIGGDVGDPDERQRRDQQHVATPRSRRTKPTQAAASSTGQRNRINQRGRRAPCASCAEQQCQAMPEPGRTSPAERCAGRATGPASVPDHAAGERRARAQARAEQRPARATSTAGQCAATRSSASAQHGGGRARGRRRGRAPPRRREDAAAGRPP